MRNLAGALLAMWMMVPGTGLAQAVVAELYTSQGCSSCPPADELMVRLAKRDDVIALALHVDYWDYLGWKDDFASPAFTNRQKAYGHAANARSIYTPQMIIGGKDHVVASRPMDVVDLLRLHSTKPQQVTVTLSRSGGVVRINAVAKSPLTEAADVQVVRYIPESKVEIEHGENAGKTIVYANIVSEWDLVGTWDGTSELALSAKAEGEAPVVVIVQKAGHGPILGAARLR